VRVTEAKALRDLIIIICPTDLIPQQINTLGFIIKDHHLSKIYILTSRIQDLVTSGNNIIKPANDIIDEI
jgi:hypothetical protein